MTATATSPQIGQDKEWITCDDWPQSPHYGNCYLSYSDTIGEQVVAQTSGDGGRTWSGLTSAPGFPGRESIRGSFAPGVQPLVLPSGRVVIAYYDEGKLSALLSDDGGATWTTELGIAPAELPHAPRPARGTAADLGGQLGRPRLRRLDRLLVPARLPGERRRLRLVHRRDRLEPADADPDRRRRRRAARPRRRPDARRADWRSPTTSTAARRSTSASSGRRTRARAGAARSCSTRAASRSAGSRRPRSARWSATTSRPRSPAAARCRSSSWRARPRSGLHEAAFGTSIAVP